MYMYGPRREIDSFETTCKERSHAHGLLIPVSTQCALLKQFEQGHGLAEMQTDHT